LAPLSRLTPLQRAFLDAFFRRTDAFFLTVFANKLSALLGRAEIRDLVDVRALERAGLQLAEALRRARSRTVA
jgi:hypothetical protein